MGVDKVHAMRNYSHWLKCDCSIGKKTSIHVYAVYIWPSKLELQITTCSQVISFQHQTNKELEGHRIPPQTSCRGMLKLPRCGFRYGDNQKKGLLSCGPRRVHCPLAEAIWLPAPGARSLNTSRWNGSHSVLLEEKLRQTISMHEKFWKRTQASLFWGHTYCSLT